jgi:glycosyltransferase involved in cell wall biosynthesis
VDVSVAICTRNRAASLVRTLESFTAIHVPDDLQWEVVVINNASLDDTDAVILRFQERLPLRREFEAAPGLSNARNRALKVIKGAYVIWTDDDVIVDQGFLAAYVEAFRRWPDAVVFGGKIIPVFEEPMPLWLRKCWNMIGDTFAHRDFGDEPLSLTREGNRIPFGANFAVLMTEQRSYLYNPKLGPGTQLYGEETDVIVRMLKDGRSGYWVPHAEVRHCISRARQTKRYISAYYRKEGRRNVFELDPKKYVGPRLFGVPRWILRRMVTNYCEYLLYRFIASPLVWMSHFKKYAVSRGEFDFYRQQRWLVSPIKQGGSN